MGILQLIQHTPDHLKHRHNPIITFLMMLFFFVSEVSGCSCDGGLNPDGAVWIHPVA